jgi:protoheme IX farnesyltransferase
MTETIKNYVLVTKPGIVCGNLIAATGGFCLASKGRPAVIDLLATVIGISLVVASGCVFNNYVDRNLDRKMARTCDRVLARGLMSPHVAVFYGSLLGTAGLVLLWAATNGLCVAIVLSGFGIYVGMYSLYLKRSSLYGTMIGSLAGAAPPLAGYCAVSNRIDSGAVILLLIFGLWQIPHSYAIAIFRFDDYNAAAIPVLPVKLGMPAAKKHIVISITAFMAATLLLTFCGYTGYGYLAAALALGLSWLFIAWSGYKTSDNRLWAKRLFIFSVLGIIVLSVMMAVDATIPGTSPTRKEYQRFTSSAAELPVFGHVGDSIDCNDDHGMYLTLREDEEKNLPGSAAMFLKN